MVAPTCCCLQLEKHRALGFRGLLCRGIKRCRRRTQRGRLLLELCHVRLLSL